MGEAAEDFMYDDADENTEAVEEQPAEEAQEPESEPEGKGEEPEASEEAPAKPAVPEFSPEQQSYINDHIVARQRARASQIEEKAAELERQLEEMRGQSQQAPQPTDGPVVPPMPDPWDSDYDQKVQERDQKLMERRDWELEQQWTERQQQQEQERQQQEEQRAQYEQVQTYTERAKSLGVAEDALTAAGNFVHQFNLPQNAINRILRDEHGPLITLHLAKNSADLTALAQTPIEDIGLFLKENIKPKVTRSLSSRKPPPDPTEPERGSGVPPKERGPDGATYE